MTQNAFAFAASAMIPIGQASTAGNLTFKSTATIVAKEGISMGAGAGAQKITTDVTGNDTAGMVAGMVASGVTAKGLNGIEAEANKLAKAPKGIDGVTEGAGNLAEDVGKAGKGLEGAANGAESAAEDAGKVVESGLNSPSECNISSKQFGKKLGKHKTDYPDLSMDEYKNLIDDVFKSPDKIIQDVENNEFLYLKGNNLLRVTNNGEFVSLYPGAESSRVLSAIEKGGTIWPK